MTAVEQSAPSLRAAVRRVVADLDGPVARAELIARVLQRHPSQARRPDGLILAEVRQCPELVRLGDGSFAPRNWILDGLAFRYAPGTEEVRTGQVGLFPCFTPFLPGSDGARKAELLLTLSDDTGEIVARQPLHARLGAVDLRTWFAAQAFAPGDSLVVTVADTAQAQFRLRREDAGRVDRDGVRAQDARLEEALYELISRNASEQPFLEEIIPAALARVARGGAAYPGSHWHTVVVDSPRLRAVDDYAVARATFRRPIDRLQGYSASAAARRNLEARIEAFSGDVARTLSGIGARVPVSASAPGLVGRDEALHRSTRQIAAYLASLAARHGDCYRCLAVPAIYLAKHEGTSLADADFGMLCRFLLSYYPRRVFFNRKSFTRRMLATLRHFYAQSQKNGPPALVTPRHLSRLHGLVDRKIALYAELDMDGPDSERLFAKLFPNVEDDDAEVLALDVGGSALAAQ